MNLSLETSMSSVVILYMILIEGVFGTYFPPVSNPPPIPGQSVRTLENPPQRFYVQENLPQDFSPSFVKDGLYSSEEKLEDQRWYLQENQPVEPRQDQGSVESFERFYQSGEPAIGPVATPIPDDAYLSQPSSIPKLNPNEPANSDVWILTRRPYNQFIPDRWVQVQLPAERIVEVVNQEPGPPLATDTVKSVIAPVSSGVPPKPQFTANTLANIIQQVWVRSPKALGSKILANPTEIIEVPSVKQVVDIPTGNVKQVVQQEVIKDVPAPPPNPPPTPLMTKKTFNPPPPPPPPLKGFDPTVKFGPIVPVNTISDSNLLVSDNGLLQRVRHIWVPTSPRTGKFISFPIPTSLNAIKPIPSPGLPIDATPVTVSDTWVLKPGPIPSFEQRKSILPPPEIPGNVVFQAPPVIKIDAPPDPLVLAQADPPKNAIIGKSIDLERPVDIWPPRNVIQSSKVIDELPSEIIPDSPSASPKSDETAITKSLTPPKGFAYIKPPILPMIVPPSAKVIDGKPCPIPLPPPLRQKYLISPRSSNVIAVPRIIAAQRRPLARIIRVNRFPSGSYYVLNNRIRPNYFPYPNAPLLQPKLVRLVQTNQIPLPFPSRQTSIPLPPKQIPIPQTKQYPAPVPAKQVLFPFQAKQIAAPIPSPKSSRTIFPAMQPTKISYPWNSKNIPVPAKGVLNPKTPLPAPISESSSESSSSESEGKTEKLEKPKAEESNTSDERERESSSEESGSKEKLAALTAGEESIEAAESQAHPEVKPHTIVSPHEDQPNEAHHVNDTDESATIHSSDEPNEVTEHNTHMNLISSPETNSENKAHPELEGSAGDTSTDFTRD